MYPRSLVSTVSRTRVYRGVVCIEDSCVSNVSGIESPVCRGLVCIQRFKGCSDLQGLERASSSSSEEPAVAPVRSSLRGGVGRSLSVPEAPRR